MAAKFASEYGFGHLSADLEVFIYSAADGAG